MSGRADASITLKRFLTKADRFSAWIIAFLTIAYIVSFPVHRAPIITILPVVAAGWFYRSKGGVIASILVILLDIF